ncbi:hypothetical protein [Bacillus rhizoplanae]
MNKNYIKGNHSSKKDTSNEKPKHPLQKISSGLSKQQADRMAKHSK